jgi:photosystem II stability/assembly factor-like uncharacterized protein
MKSTLILSISILFTASASVIGAWQNLDRYQWQNIHLRSAEQSNQQMIGGEGFQQLMDIEYSPSDPRVIYFTTDTTQVWKSTDGGDNWSPKHTNLRALGGLSLLVDQNTPERVLLAGFTAKDTNASGIYITENGGDTWERVFDRGGYRKDWIVRGQDLFIQQGNEFIAATQNGQGLVLISENGTNGGANSRWKWSSIEFDDQSDIRNDQLGMILNLKKNPHSANLEIWISSYSGLYKLTESNNAQNHYHCKRIKSVNTGLPSLFTGWTRINDPIGITTLIDSSTKISSFTNERIVPSALRINFENSRAGYWHTQWSKPITLTPGVEYTITGNISLYREVDNHSGGVLISAVDSDDNSTRWATNAISTNTTDNPNVPQWEEVARTFTPTGEEPKVKIVLQRKRNNSVTGSAWFDDIKLYRSDDPNEENLLKNTQDSEGGSADDYAGFYGDTPTTVHFGSSPGEIIVSVGLHGVYKSIDGGDTFEPWNSNLPASLVNKKRIHIDGSRYNAHVLAAGFHMQGGTNFISIDGGTSWNRIDICSINDKDMLNDIHPREDIHKNYFTTPTGFHPRNENRMIRAFEGSIIFKSIHRNSDTNNNCDNIDNSDDRHRWNYSSEGYSGARAGGGFAFGNARNPRTTRFFLTDHGPYATDDGGRTWRRLLLPSSIGNNNSSAGDAINNNIVTSIGPWRLNTNQQLVRSTNGGETWAIDRNTNTGEEPMKYKFIAFDPVTERIVYADNYISKNYGWSWSPLPKHRLDGETEARTLTVIAVSPTTGAIYAKDKNVDKLRETTQIWRSTTKGREWNPIATNDIPVKPNNLSKLAVSPDNDFIVYAVTTNNGLYKLDQQNGLWEQRNQGITNDIPDHPADHYSTKYIAIDPLNPNVIYIGKNGLGYGQSDGVFMSVDSGESWENISKNLGLDSTVWGLKVNPNNDAIYIASSLGTWALSSLRLNYHFDEAISDFIVHNDSLYSITTSASELGDGNRGRGTSIVQTNHGGGTALHFNGSEDAYVEIPTYTTPLENIKNVFTIEAMVRIGSDDSLVNGPIISDKNRLNAPGGFLLKSWRGHLLFTVTSDTDSDLKTVITSSRNLEKYEWYHVVATFYRGAAKLYINGEEEGNNADNIMFQSTTLQSSESLFLGKSQINAANLEGDIDEVRIYDRVLTQREIINHDNWFR